jgi:serine/threonine-protein kinase
MSPIDGPLAGSLSAADATESLAGPEASSSASSSAAPMTGARPPKWKGRILKRFKLVDLLGQGAMGKVFRAEDVTLRRYVALKVLPTRTKEGQRDHKIDQFVREARSAATIDHPNAVTVYEIGESSGVHYIAMELVEGGNLEKLIKASGPMEIDRACQIAAEAAEALAAAHAMGVIHRDVKPSNLLLARNGRCKLADFGLARYDDPEDLTPRGECVGTPCYIAPELPLGQKATAQSDIYSLGCALWFLLTGKPPFEAKSKQDMMKMHVYAALPDLRERRGDVPERLVETITRACAKNPADRFESADQFAKVLRTFTIRTGTGSSSGRLPTLAGAMNASGSMPGWSPDAPLTASSTNLGPHMSHGGGSLAQVPPMESHPTPQPARRFLDKLGAPVIWASVATVATAILIGIGVWIARDVGGGGAATPGTAGGSGKVAGSNASPAQNVSARQGGDLSHNPDAKTAPNALLNSGLDEEDANDGIAGWYVHPTYIPMVTGEREDGNRFVRITPASDTATPHVDQRVEIDPTWTAVAVAVRMRVSDFKAGPKGRAEARVGIEFWESEGKSVGGTPPNLPALNGNSPWVEKVTTVRIPTGAKFMHVKLAVFNATGSFDFDDLRVIPQLSK